MDHGKMTAEQLERLVHRRDVKGIREAFDTYQIVDLAELVADLEIRDALFIFKVISRHQASELFTYLDKDSQEKLVSILTSDQIKGILADVYADDIADVVGELPADLARKILAAVPAERRKEINELLSYKENSCGSIMTTDYVEIPLQDTIGEAMREVRDQRQIAESISYGYVVDKEKLAGEIPLRDILLAPDDTPIHDVMDDKPVYVRTNDDQEVALDRIREYDMEMIPVCDEDGDLVGVITADDLMDVMEQEATEDIHKMNAVVPVSTGYLETPAWKVARSCLPWLLVLMFYDSISEGIINANSAIVALYPALSVYLPMLMGTAGNAGSQASTMVIRGIVVDKMDMHSFGMVLWKEMRVGCLCGAVLFAVNFLKVSLLSSAGTEIALISSVTLFLVVVLGKLIGGSLPLLAQKAHLDPAVMAAPIVTSICDMISLTVYFRLAERMLL